MVMMMLTFCTYVCDRWLSVLVCCMSSLSTHTCTCLYLSVPCLSVCVCVWQMTVGVGLLYVVTKYSHLYLSVPCLSVCVCVWQMSVGVGLLYVVTKYSHLYLCDVETATCLHNVSLSSHIIFTTAVSSSMGGLLCVNTAGQVSVICLHSLSPSPWSPLLFTFRTINEFIWWSYITAITKFIRRYYKVVHSWTFWCLSEVFNAVAEAYRLPEMCL